MFREKVRFLCPLSSPFHSHLPLLFLFQTPVFEPKFPTLTTLLPHSLAYLEMRMVLAKLMWAYDIIWFNSAEVVWERDTKGYTLWEKPELRVELSLHPGTTIDT